MGAGQQRPSLFSSKNKCWWQGRHNSKPPESSLLLHRESMLENKRNDNNKAEKRDKQWKWKYYFLKENNIVN